MNNPFVALYLCYFVIAGGVLYTAWQGTETGSVGKPCVDAMLKMDDVSADPATRHAAQQDQEAKCKAMANYDAAVYRMMPKSE